MIRSILFGIFFATCCWVIWAICHFGSPLACDVETWFCALAPLWKHVICFSAVAAFVSLSIYIIMTREFP